MRTLIFSSILVLFVISAVGFSDLDRLAFEPLGMIRYDEIIRPGEELVIHVNVLNDGDEDLDNIRVSAYMPELGLFARSSRFDLDDNEKQAKVVFFDIPYYTVPGVYLMQVSVQNENDIRFRSKAFRYVWVI